MRPAPRPRLRTVLLVLALGGTTTAASCLQCKDIACSGGFEWVGRPRDGAIPPGSYHLAITLDEGSYDFDCTVTERARESECQRSGADDDDEFELSVELGSLQTTDEWDPDAPVADISVDAWSFEDEEQRSTRGPRDVQIVLEREGIALVDETFAVVYERDEDFYGDERCGYCDQLQTRASEWAED